MTPDICIGEVFEESLYAELVERAAIECYKWNLAAGDRPILAKYPLLIPRAHWSQLLTLAETLERESQEAEKELLNRPALHRRLGIPEATARLSIASEMVECTPVYALRFPYYV